MLSQLQSSLTGLAVIAASANLIQTVAGSLSIRQDDCSDVHIFLAKGNNETEPGRQGKLVDAICSELDSCTYEDIHFDNRYETVFCRSLEEGAASGRAQLTDYAERCPDTKLVVSGYSQGAHVVGDILGGGQGIFFQNCSQSPNQALDPETSPGNKIVAALLFGDTRHVADQSYNTLSGAPGNGIFPRDGQLLSDLNRYSDVLRSWCAETDPICAADMGPIVAESHLNYFDLYSNEAGEWVRQMVAASGNGSSNSTSRASGSTTSTTTSTTSSSTQSSTSTSTATASKSSSTSATETSAESAASTSEDNNNNSGAGVLHFPLGIAVLAAVLFI